MNRQDYEGTKDSIGVLARMLRTEGRVQPKGLGELKALRGAVMELRVQFQRVSDLLALEKAPGVELQKLKQAAQVSGATLDEMPATLDQLEKSFEKICRVNLEFPRDPVNEQIRENERLQGIRDWRSRRQLVIRAPGVKMGRVSWKPL
jgi:hypothetical protein